MVSPMGQKCNVGSLARGRFSLTWVKSTINLMRYTLNSLSVLVHNRPTQVKRASPLQDSLERESYLCRVTPGSNEVRSAKRGEEVVEGLFVGYIHHREFGGHLVAIGVQHIIDPHAHIE